MVWWKTLTLTHRLVKPWCNGVRRFAEGFNKHVLSSRYLQRALKCSTITTRWGCLDHFKGCDSWLECLKPILQDDWWHGNFFLGFFSWKCKVTRARGNIENIQMLLPTPVFQDMRISTCMMSSKDIVSAVFRWCSLPETSIKSPWFARVQFRVHLLEIGLKLCCSLPGTSIKSPWFARVHFRVHLLEIGLKLCCRLSSKLTRYPVIFEGSPWKVPSVSCVLVRTCRLTLKQDLPNFQPRHTDRYLYTVAYILQCNGKYLVSSRVCLSKKMERLLFQ